MLIRIINGNIKKAYGQDHEIVDIVVQPPSIIGNEIPTFFNIASAAGVIAPVMKFISIVIPVKATPSVKPAEIASFNFILTIKPARIIIIGTKIAAPKSNNDCTTVDNNSIYFYLLSFI